MNMDMSMDNGKGGFLNDTQSASSDKSLKRAQNIVPLMIGQILKSSGELELWGMSVRMLTVIGILRSINESSVKVAYEIEDETGMIVALKWLEANKTIPEPSLEINTYVKVFGLLRNQNGIKQIFAMRITPLEDLVELTTHLLEVTYISLKAKELYKEQIKDNISLSSNDKFAKLTNTNNPDYSGMTVEQATIFNIIQSDTSESGIERCEVRSRTPAHIINNVDKIIHFLISEGHIYTTCTDDHFKAT